LTLSNPINEIALIKLVSDLGELPVQIVGMDGNVLVPLNNLITGNIQQLFKLRWSFCSWNFLKIKLIHLIVGGLESISLKKLIEIFIMTILG